MKILYLTHNIDPKNGWGRYSRDIIYGMKSAGHDIVILKEEDDGWEGVPIIYRDWRIIVSIFKILLRIDVWRSDIIHALDLYPYGIIAWVINIFLRKKMFITAVGTYSVAPLHGKWSWFAKKSYMKADKVIAISEYTKEAITNILPQIKIDVITPGIDFEKFKIHHIPSEPPYLLSVGALKFRKGYETSLAAFAEVKKVFPDLKYVIVGSGSYKKILYERINSLHIKDDVIFMDNISDEELRKIYACAQLFILTSVNHKYHFEGYGLVFLEAAAAGLPVIGTLDNGISDAVDEGINGILVPQYDIETTRDAILDVLNNQDKWKKMSDSSYRFAERNDIRLSLDKYLLLYKIQS